MRIRDGSAVRKFSPRYRLERMTCCRGEVGMELPLHGMDETRVPGFRASARESVTDMSTYFIRKSLSEKSKGNILESSSWNSLNND